LQASGKNFFKLARDPGSLVFLSIYLALSFTGLSPAIVFIPLALSGICLLIEPTSLPPQGFIAQDPLAILAITLFLFSYVASVLFSHNTMNSLNALTVLFPGLLVAYTLGQLRPGFVHNISWCLLLAVAACSCVVILMFVQSSHVDPARVFHEEGTATLVVPNDVLAGVIFSPVVASVWIYGRHPLMKVLAVLSLAILAIAVYLTESRVAILTLVFMTLLYLLLHNKQRFLLHGAIMLIALYLIDAVLDLGIIRNFYLLREQNARLGIWLAGLMHWSDHPILGFGPSNFEIAYDLGLSELSLPDWVDIEPRRVPWAHSLYVEAVVERGLLGLIALVFLLAVIFSRLRNHAQLSAKPSTDFHISVFIAFVGFLFAGLFEPTMQRIWVANLLFIFLGLACIPYEKPDSYQS
jgi:O-antigen ligase